jgi:hypothetical protein
VKMLVGLLVAVLVPVAALAAGSPSGTVVAQASQSAPAQATPPAKATSPAPAKATEPAKPKGREAAVVTLRGTVEAVDMDKKTVTIKGPKRTLVVQVADPKKLEAIKVGDPVVGKYYEAVAFEVKKPGSATPGMTSQQAVATSQPGAAPAGAAGEQVTITATITAIDKKAHTVTIKGPEGNSETVKARNPKNLDAVKVGDLVEITYTRALAIALDKSAKK